MKNLSKGPLKKLETAKQRISGFNARPKHNLFVAIWREMEAIQNFF